MEKINITKSNLIYVLAQLNQKITRQLLLIFELTELKNLQSRWTELALLTQTINNSKIILKLIDLQWSEVEKDLNTALDLDNSSLFNHIYDQELGLAGGEPFALMLANYELDLRKINTVSTLSRLGELGAFALIPIITNVSSEVFGGSSYNHTIDFDKELEITDLRAWQRARQAPQFRFINVALPTLQLTVKYEDLLLHLFRHTIDINTSILLAMRVIESFKQTQWFTEILGFFSLHDLIMKSALFPFAAIDISLDCKTFLKSSDELALGKTGFIPLLQTNKNKPLYFGNTYCAYKSTEVVSTLLDHILCACRFGQHVKILARQKIGAHADERDCEQFIANWLTRYTATLKEHSLRAHYPLKRFQIKLAKVPGRIGYYSCQILLEPHMKLESMNTQIILHSEILASQ
ncbi:MAG: hypothetical protein EXR81_01530 [Gammaproteobacteria bacterium]|nr:hypothetical protein [Gammaproteobacteria bacterium]